MHIVICTVFGKRDWIKKYEADVYRAKELH